MKKRPLPTAENRSAVVAHAQLPQRCSSPSSTSPPLLCTAHTCPYPDRDPNNVVLSTPADGVLDGCSPTAHARPQLPKIVDFRNIVTTPPLCKPHRAGERSAGRNQLYIGHAPPPTAAPAPCSSPVPSCPKSLPPQHGERSHPAPSHWSESASTCGRAPATTCVTTARGAVVAVVVDVLVVEVVVEVVVVEVVVEVLVVVVVVVTVVVLVVLVAIVPAYPTTAVGTPVDCGGCWSTTSQLVEVPVVSPAHDSGSHRTAHLRAGVCKVTWPTRQLTPLWSSAAARCCRLY